MLSELVEKLAEQAVEAQGIEVVHDCQLRKILVRNGKDMQVHDFAPDPRSGVVRGLADVVKAASDDRVCVDPEVYHDEERVTVVCNRADRHERIIMPLDMTTKFRTLVKFRDRKEGMTPRGLIRLLRFDLAGPGSSGVQPVISGLSKVNFTRHSDGRSHVEHGRESLGKSVEMAVQAADKIPESFTVQLPVYSNPGLADLSTVGITVGVHVDLDDERVVLSPLADELRRAVHVAQLSIGAELQKNLPEVPVLNGHP